MTSARVCPPNPKSPTNAHNPNPSDLSVVLASSLSFPSSISLCVPFHFLPTSRHDTQNFPIPASLSIYDLIYSSRSAVDGEHQLSRHLVGQSQGRHPRKTQPILNLSTTHTLFIDDLPNPKAATVWATSPGRHQPYPTMAPPAEISIPRTSLHTPTDGSKPYTLYNITLRLPLRSFVVQKRYSEFAALHTTLVHLVNAPPPAPLPAKSWFKRTVSSTDLTETRREGLEKYLRAIAETPDRRWRDTSAWRAFLNLPSSSTTNSAASSSGIRVEGRIPAIGLRDANLAAASDPTTWMDLHREVKEALHQARISLARRDAANDNAARIEAGSAAKRALVKAGNLIATLNDGLRLLKDGGRVGEGELRRRRDLLSASRTEREGLEKLSASLAASGSSSARQGMPSSSEHAALLGNGPSSGPRAGGRVLGAPLPETEQTRELDNEGVLQLQRNLMAEQDQEVEALAKMVRRQREMGLAIKEEVEGQTELLAGLDGDVNRVAGKIQVGKERARRLG